MNNPFAKNTRQHDYQKKLAAESKKWGEHLKVEASGEWHAWLDHPLIAKHYQQRALVDGLPWEKWIQQRFGGPAERSLDLGCGAGYRSVAAYQAGATQCIEGYDVSADRIAEGERRRTELGIPGHLQVSDINTMELPRARYDLIFSCHSFHHFLELEHICAQVHEALTPRGLFILDEFVGPTQFQWTDQQIEVVRTLMSLIPPELRMLRWGALKTWEGRPTPEEVVAVSPFESIRSAEIFPFFKQYFDLVAVRLLGGTLQHLLYNGIAHNFRPDHPDAGRIIEGVYKTEDALIDTGLLPSDFMLLVGQRKDASAAP